MDTVLIKFSEQLDMAISLVDVKINEGTLTENQLEMAKKTKLKLSALKDNALQGNLLRPSSGKVPSNIQLGLTRFAQEWTSDKKILAHFNFIESYYSSRV